MTGLTQPVMSLEDFERIVRALGPALPIDVSRFTLGDPCPRCAGRRVYAVEQDKNLWLCIDNAMPIPWRADQVTEHDAAEFTQDPQVIDE